MVKYEELMHDEVNEEFNSMASSGSAADDYILVCTEICEGVNSK